MTPRTEYEMVHGGVEGIEEDKNSEHNTPASHESVLRANLLLLGCQYFCGSIVAVFLRAISKHVPAVRNTNTLVIVSGILLLATVLVTAFDTLYPQKRGIIVISCILLPASIGIVPLLLSDSDFIVLMYALINVSNVCYVFHALPRFSVDLILWGCVLVSFVSIVQTGLLYAAHILGRSNGQVFLSVLILLFQVPLLVVVLVKAILPEKMPFLPSYPKLVPYLSMFNGLIASMTFSRFLSDYTDFSFKVPFLISLGSAIFIFLGVYKFSSYHDQGRAELGSAEALFLLLSVCVLVVVGSHFSTPALL